MTGFTFLIIETEGCVWISELLSNGWSSDPGCALSVVLPCDILMDRLPFFLEGEDWSRLIAGETTGRLFLFPRRFVGSLFTWLKAVRMPLTGVESV